MSAQERIESKQYGTSGHCDIIHGGQLHRIGQRPGSYSEPGKEKRQYICGESSLFHEKDNKQDEKYLQYPVQDPNPVVTGDQKERFQKEQIAMPVTHILMEGAACLL